MLLLTIQQLQYVMEIQRTGSVSKAAKNLFLSQPNISNAVKTLEKELGIDIFERTHEGMRPTVQGRQFLLRAERIMKEVDGISADLLQEPPESFRMLYGAWFPAYEAFVRLCQDHQNHAKISFSAFSIGTRDPLEEMAGSSYDLCVSEFVNERLLLMRCKQYHMEYKHLAQTQLYVQLAENHPLLNQSGSHFEHLRDYPYVDFYFPGLSDDVSPLWTDFVNPERIIRVNSPAARRAIVSHSNAFSIVMPHSTAFNKRHGIVNIPIPQLTANIGYIYSLDRGLSKLAREYLHHLDATLSHALNE